MPPRISHQGIQNPKRSEFTLRFFWVLTVGLAVVLVLVNSVFLLPSVRTIEANISTLQLEIAAHARTSLLASLQELIKAHRDAAEAIGRDPQDAQELMSLFLKNNKFYDDASFIGSDGRELFRLNRFAFVPRADLEDRKNETGVVEALRGNTYFGPVFFSDTAEPLQEIFVPISSPQGVIQGVLAGRLNLRFMWNLMADAKVGQRGRVYVVDQRGNLIADPNPSIVLRGENLLFRPPVRKIVEEGELVDGLAPQDRYKNFDGVEVFAVGLPLETFGWGLIAEQPLSDAFEARNRTINLGIVSIIVSIILIAILGFNVRELVHVARDLNRERTQTLAIISNLTDGLIQYDDSFTILMMNNAASRMLGISAPELLGKRFSAQDISKPGLTSFLQVLFPILSASARVIPTGQGQPRLVEMQIREPFERDLQIVTISVPDPVTETTNYLKILRDVTREKAIDRSKSEFISIAAHQLRTPLSAIKWSIRLLLDGDIGELTKDQRSFLVKGYETNERLIRLVSDLLDVARIEEGRFGYSFSRADLVALIAKNVDSFENIAQEKHITLSFEKPDKAISLLTFDSSKIALVLQNLVENAINYNKPGGKVIVRIEEEMDFVKVSVSDTGVGIPRHQLSRLFTKFFRGENVIRMQTEGSGLGLFIVRNIIKRHGGEIEIVSEEGKGSTFSFKLPQDESRIPVVETSVAGI